MKNKLTRWIVFEWGKPTRQKPHKVILRSPLPNKWLQVKEFQYLIPTYSWTLTPIPNWTCSAMTISPFQCMAPNMWLTNCADPSTRLQSLTREGYWLQSSLVHHTRKIEKLLGYKTLRRTKTTTSSQERWTRENSVIGHNLLEQTLFNTCAICVTFYDP